MNDEELGLLYTRALLFILACQVQRQPELNPTPTCKCTAHMTRAMLLPTYVTLAIGTAITDPQNSEWSIQQCKPTEGACFPMLQGSRPLLTALPHSIYRVSNFHPAQHTLLRLISRYFTILDARTPQTLSLKLHFILKNAVDTAQLKQSPAMLAI